MPSGGFEDLDTDAHEPLKRRLERHTYDRLIMLSDGVFAIAITLAALEIRPPDRWRDLQGLIEQARFPVTAYLISFAVVASYWTSQRELIGRLVRVDRTFVLMALTELMLVALIPAATELLYRHGPDVQAVQVYGGLLATCGYLAACMWAYGAFAPGLMHPEERRAYRWGRLATALIVPVVFTWIAVTGASLTVAPLVAGAALLVMRRVALPRFAEPK